MSKDLFFNVRETEAIFNDVAEAVTNPFYKIQDKITTIHKKVEYGDRSAFDGLIELEVYRKQLDNALALIKGFKDTFNDQLASASTEYKDGYKGYKIETRSGGRTFVYKAIPEWADAEKSKKEIEAKYKSMFLAIEKGNVNANISEDGEILPLPEITYRKGSIILKKA
jgi:hypothetical protein